MKRHAGLVYGHSRGKAPGSKHYYRKTYTVNPSTGWNQFLRAHAEGAILQVCCGGSRIGAVRVDIDLEAPAINVVADMLELPFKEKSFDTVIRFMSSPIRSGLNYSGNFSEWLGTG